MDEEAAKGLMTAVGMSIAYIASGLGMLFAWLGYRKRQHEGDGAAHDREASGHG